MTDVLGRRRRQIATDDLGRRLSTAVIAAQIAAAADQLEAAYRQIEPHLNTLSEPTPEPVRPEEKR